jgi:hypothetical protein
MYFTVKIERAVQATARSLKAPSRHFVPGRKYRSLHQEFEKRGGVIGSDECYFYYLSSLPTLSFFRCRPTEDFYHS